MNDQVTTGRDVVARIQAAHSMLVERFRVFHEAQKKAFDYVIGEQITRDNRKKLIAANRPAMVYNLLMPLVLYIAGTLSSEKRKLRAIPVRQGDEQLSEFHTVLVSDYAIGQDGYTEIAKAALNAAIGKVGWVEQHWSTKENPEGDHKIRAFDPFMVMWDPDGKRISTDDWRYIEVTAWYTAEEISAIYSRALAKTPGLQQKLMAEAEKLEGLRRKDGRPIGWWERVWRGTADFLGVKRNNFSGVTNDFADSAGGIYRVIEWHDRRTVTERFVYNPLTRQSTQIPLDNVDESATASALATPDFAGGQVVDKTREELWLTVIVPGLLPDDVIQENPYEVQKGGFSLKPIFCYDFHPDLVQAVGIVDSLIDPQDSFNQRRMTQLEALMNAVNPDTVYPEGSIHPDEEAVWESKERGKMKKYTPVAGRKPEYEHPLPEAFQGAQMFQQEDAELTQRISGISPNQQGFKETNKETGILYAKRVEQGLVMLNYFMSNLELAMRHVFKYADRNLQTFLTLPRAIRLLDESSSDVTWLQVNMPTIQGVLNDVTQGEYDFIVDAAEIGRTARQMKFIEAMEFVKTVPPELVLWPELFALWDSPVAGKMKAFAEQQMGQMLQMQAIQQGAATAQAVKGAVMPPVAPGGGPEKKGPPKK